MNTANALHVDDYETVYGGGPERGTSRFVCSGGFTPEEVAPTCDGLNLAVAESQALPKNTFLQTAKMVMAAVWSQPLPSIESFWQKYGAALGILATVFGLWFTISSLNRTINNTVSEKAVPIAKNIEVLSYSVNGNPETGAKGVNERLASIEAKLPAKE